MCHICLMWWRKSWDCKGGFLFILTPWIFIYRYWVYVKHEFCWLDLWWSLILRWPLIKSQEKYLCLGYKYYKCDKLKQKRQIFFSNYSIDTNSWKFWPLFLFLMYDFIYKWRKKHSEESSYSIRIVQLHKKNLSSVLNWIGIRGYNLLAILYFCVLNIILSRSWFWLTEKHLIKINITRWII